MSSISLQDLIAQGEDMLARETSDKFGFKYVNYQDFKEWERLADLFLQTNYPNNQQTTDFHNIVWKFHNQSSECKELLAILKAFDAIQPDEAKSIDYSGVQDSLFDKFHLVANQLKRRHDSRETLRIKDEYDVQDLLEALLNLFFADVRPEEWCPSYAGSSKRMDFLLKNENIVIEVKKTRDTLKDKEIGEQLIADIANYKTHPNCNKLYCFVYDSDSLIWNPRGIESDLSKNTDGLEVVVCVCPK